MRAALPTLLVLLASPALADGATGRTAEDAAKAGGYKLLEPEIADFDGDGKDDVIGACQNKTSVRLCILHEVKKNQFSLDDLLPPSGGTRLGKLVVRNLIPPENATEALLEVYSENPDEKIKRIRVYAGYRTPREIFTSVIFRPRDASKHPIWETNKGVVAYGDWREGWYFVDVDDDNTSEIVVRQRPQYIEVPRDDDPARLITGVREEVWEFMGDGANGVYVARGEVRMNKFLPAYPVQGVTASTTYIKPDVLADLESDALAEAVYAAADGADVDNPTVDRAPFTIRGADGSLETGWIEDDAKTSGETEWLQVDLGEPKPIRMVQLVLGCVSDKRTFRAHNVPTEFEIRFDNGERATVHTGKLKQPDRPAIAQMQMRLDKKRTWAKRTFVFFSGDNVSKTVRVILGDAKRQGRGNHTCISEVSVH